MVVEIDDAIIVVTIAVNLAIIATIVIDNRMDFQASVGETINVATIVNKKAISVANAIYHQDKSLATIVVTKAIWAVIATNLERNVQKIVSVVNNLVTLLLNVQTVQIIDIFTLIIPELIKFDSFQF